MKKRIFKNLIIAGSVGIVYSLFLCELPMGLISTFFVFAFLGVFYSVIISQIEGLLRKHFRQLEKWVTPIFCSMVILFLGFGILLVLFEVGGWPLLYSVFRWRGTDPLGPGLINPVFIITFAAITLVWRLTAEVIQARLMAKNSGSALPRVET